MTTQKTGRPTGKTGQAKVLDDKELKRVLSVVESGNHAKRNTAIVILSNYLGLRSKELVALKIGDVIEHNTIKKVLRLVAAYTKGARHRDVSLENKAVVKALQEYISVGRAEDGMTFNIDAPLFRSQKGTAFSPNAMVRVLGDI
jgi:integrase/recombinase XerD